MHCPFSLEIQSVLCQGIDFQQNPAGTGKDHNVYCKRRRERGTRDCETCLLNIDVTNSGCSCMASSILSTKSLTGEYITAKNNKKLNVQMYFKVNFGQTHVHVHRYPNTYV